ncbi:galactose mutarotase-like enzyme [Paenibacillus taihuensis]|uniref:Galactose mutarotase-like enzyme n=1 Tax=Paenibacillus taihuensis TaxID=1156355 RepID=A0A3D9RI72_9BACL|nr:aldose epimerase [Paenibacillus taihuensis]REE78779.1 galactose mutarotase-like enzyme [Paenibacillus taihuensis]
MSYEVMQTTDTYELYTLIDTETNSSVTVCPERGGIAISCVLGGVELFYLDKDTLLDPVANIRGGNPVLFPICGQLVEGRYEWEGESYTMRNHGVARNRPWEVVSTNEDGEASITLRFRSDASTKLEFPWDFELLFTYALVGGELQIRQAYSNFSDSEMPYYAGFHPYFRSASKDLLYGTDALKFLDYNDNIVKEVQGEIALSGLKESVALLDASEPHISFPGPDGSGKVAMRYSDAFKYVVLWQVNGSPFVCVEPWMALTGALNRRDELPMLAAGAKQQLELSIAFEK